MRTEQKPYSELSQEELLTQQELAIQKAEELKLRREEKDSKPAQPKKVPTVDDPVSSDLRAPWVSITKNW